MDSTYTTSAPHGGRLIDRVVTGSERQELLKEASFLPAIEIDDWEASDIELIGNGAFSPLKGFMDQDDYLSVVRHMRLADGTIWSLPVTLAVDDTAAKRLRLGDRVALVHRQGNSASVISILTIRDIFRYNKEHEALETYKTLSTDHPGVRKVMGQGDILIGGTLEVIGEPIGISFPEYRLTPASMRRIFASKGWRTVVGFQTRNPIHRAHEYIQKCALEICDGLLIHPIVGQTKSDDISAEVRMKSYEAILQGYYPKDRTLLSVLPAAMRYGGPREAVFHAIVRKNYGCTHFIVGRDHAGVGNFYGTYDAQLIFREIKSDELGITPLFFEHTFYCTACGNMASPKTCPHTDKDHLTLSGTRVREMLSKGQVPPPEFTRPEVASVLIEGMFEREGIH